MTIIPNDKKKETKKFYSVIIIGILSMFIIGSLPPFGEVTVMGMRLLGVFVGCIFMWLFGYLAVGGLIGVLALALYIPGNTGNAVFPSVFGNYNLIMVFFCMVFCCGLQKCGVIKYISDVILASKFATKSPWHLSVAFWAVGTVVAMILTNPLATVLLVFGVFYGVAEQLGLEKRSNYVAFTLILTATFAGFSAALLPYSPTLLVPIGIMQATAPEIGAIPMMKVLIVNWSLVIVAFIVAALLLKVLLKTGYLKCNVELDKDFVIVKKEDIHLTKGAKWGFFYIAVVMFIMICTSILPAENAIYTFANRLGTIGTFLIVLAMMALTTVDGERLITVEGCISGGVPWGLYMLLAAALTLAGTLAKPEAGVLATVQAFASSHLNIENNFLFLFAILVFALVLTNCINNVVAQQLVVPLMTLLILSKGLNPVLAVGLIGIVIDHGNVMPSGSPIGALMHGNSEWMSSKQVYFYATLGSICGVIGLLIAVPLCLTLV